MRGYSSVIIACCLTYLGLTDLQADDLVICSNHNAPVDEQIESCSSLLKQRQLSRKDLSIAYSHRALAYQRVNRYNKALLDYQKSIRLMPKNAKIHLNLGVTYERLGQLGRAIANYTISVKRNPKFSTAYFNRANAFEARGDYDKAISDYKKSIQLSVDDADAFNNLANVYYKLGRTEEALAVYRKALTIEPDHRQAKFNLQQIIDPLRAETVPVANHRTSKIKDNAVAAAKSPEKVNSDNSGKEQKMSHPASENSASTASYEAPSPDRDTQKEIEKEEEKEEDGNFSLPPGIIVTGTY